ncbi:MAG: serine protease [Planctomycetes bacterium]|nr:serine protease [Planctomycetota bacterium]MCB9871450.1 serine protease [Planctomycetota bacterium]
MGCVLLFAAVVAAQGGGGFYAFPDRTPKTAIEKTVAKLLPSLVKVHGASGLKTIQSYSTGILVSDKGHVLTLDLILIQEERTKVVLHDGTVCQVEVYPADETYGVRILKIKDEDLKKLKQPLVPLTIAKEQKHRNGTFVVSIGNCFRLAEFSEKLSVTLGVIVSRMRSGLRYHLQDVDYGGELIVTDAPNNPGHYGGGLFTVGGEWIGLNTKIVESTETNSQVSAAIPTGELIGYIQRCITRGKAGAVEPERAVKVVPVFHGIELFDHGRRVSPPAYVERVARGSPGRTAGLRPDDLIVQIDRKVVHTCKDFNLIMEKYKPGQTITVTFKRGRKVSQTELKLAEVK